MRDLAPDVFRQRLLIEAIYGIEVSEDTIQCFFTTLLSQLGLTAAGNALINSSIGQGKPENQGLEAFQPLIESGVALYTWQSSRFLSMIVYTCKAFDEANTVQIVQDFFQTSALEHKSF